MKDFYNGNWINLDGNWIHKTAIVHDNVSLGVGNIIGAYSVIGSNGEIRGVDQELFKGKVEIGDNNIISELVTIQRPFEETRTKIGNNNLIMAHSHIGHDVQIGNDCEICSGSIIGGYVIIKDKVKVKLGVTIRNRKIINEGSLIGLGSVVVKDVEGGSVVVGNPAKKMFKNCIKCSSCIESIVPTPDVSEVLFDFFCDHFQKSIIKNVELHSKDNVVAPVFCTLKSVKP